MQLKQIRTNVDDEFHQLFIIAAEKALDFDFEKPMPRVAKRQTFRNNIITVSVKGYYKITNFIQLLDLFISQLDKRFLDKRDILCNLQILLPIDPSAFKSKEKVEYLANFYSEDLEGTEVNLIFEIQMWYLALANTAESLRPKNAIDSYLL